MSKYDEYLGSALTGRVGRMMKQASELLSLREELVIVNVLCGDALVGYNNAKQICAETEGMSLMDQERVLHIARSRLYDAIDRVKEMTLAAKRVEENGDVMNVASIHTLITNWVGILEQEIEQIEEPLAILGTSGQSLLDRVADRTRQELVVANSIPKSQLTHARLDAEVRAMHGSVPYVEEESKAG